MLALSPDPRNVYSVCSLEEQSPRCHWELQTLCGYSVEDIPNFQQS